MSKFLVEIPLLLLYFICVAEPVDCSVFCEDFDVCSVYLSTVAVPSKAASTASNDFHVFFSDIKIQDALTSPIL